MKLKYYQETYNNNQNNNGSQHLLRTDFRLGIKLIKLYGSFVGASYEGGNNAPAEKVISKYSLADNYNKVATPANPGASGSAGGSGSVPTPGESC